MQLLFFVVEWYYASAFYPSNAYVVDHFYMANQAIIHRADIRQKINRSYPKMLFLHSFKCCRRRSASRFAFHHPCLKLSFITVVKNTNSTQLLTIVNKCMRYE